MKKAFTLIELLVVIAIIAILAAILFPVFAQAKLAAKKTAGLAQMKQIGTGVQLYAGDYDDGLPTWDWYYAFYPTGGRAANWSSAGSPGPNRRLWDALLQPYVKSDDFTRPASFADAEYGGIWRSPGAEYGPKVGRSIGYNQLLFWDITGFESGGNCLGGSTSAGSGCYVWPSNNIIEYVAETVFVGDGGTEGRYEPTYFKDAYYDKYVMRQRYRRAAPWRYGDSANYVFTDGHAKSFNGDRIYPIQKGPVPATWFAWSTAANVANICAAGKFFAPNAGSRALIEARAVANGGTCGGFN